MEGKGLDTTDVRLSNKYHLVDLLYQKKESTRQKLLSEMHVSAPTFWSVLRELQELGLVVDGEQLQARNGRKPMTLRFDYSARTALGIDLYGEKAVLILTDLAGSILAQECLLFGDSLSDGTDYGEFYAYSEEFPRRVKAFLEQYVSKPDQFLGIGVALHGYVQDGQWFRSDRTIPIEAFQKQFDCPVICCGTAHLAGFAEVWMKGIRNAIYLTIGVGVGGAVILDGEVFYGKNNRAGDLGHFVVEPNGKKCICGRRGCLASRIGLHVIYENEGFENAARFAEALQNGNEKALLVWDQYLRDLASGICSLSSILDQDVLIGGGVVNLLRDHMPELMKAIEEHNTPGNPLGSEIYLSDFEEDINVSAVGAALYVVSQYLKNVY